MARHPSNPSYCIFCAAKYSPGNTRTGEHIWPEWYSKIVPKTLSKHQNFRLKARRQGHGNVFHISHEQKQRTGDIASRKMNVVCARCNSGWMSGIETQNMSLMKKLINGEKTPIYSDDQKSLATWISLKAMVAELDDTEHMGFSDFDRKEFFLNKRPPHNSFIWIGYYGGSSAEWKSKYLHNGFCLAPPNLVIPLDGKITSNAQTTTFVGGHLYMHIFHSAFVFFQPRFDSRTNSLLCRIWPPTNSVIQWPLSPAMTDEDNRIAANAIAMAALNPK